MRVRPGAEGLRGFGWGRLLRVAILLWVLTAGPAPALDLEVWEYPRIASPEDPSNRFAWIERLLASFERDHPGVRIRLTKLTWKAGGEKLRIGVFAGRPPDLVSGTLDPALLETGAIEPIDDFLTDEDRDDYHPQALAAFGYQGRTWGWPWCRKGDLLYLNLEALEAAGVSPPEGGRFTPEGFRSALAALAARRAADPGAPYPLGFAFAPARSAEMALLEAPGRRLLDAEGRLGLRGPGVEAAYSRLRDWLDGGIVPPGAPGWSEREVWLAFARDRQVAMAGFGLWAIGGLTRQAGFRFGLAALPPQESGPGLAPSATVGWFVLRRPGRPPEATRMAQALARFLTMGEGQAVLRDYGQMPARRSAGELYADRPLERQAGALLAEAADLPPHSRWAAFDELLKRRIQTWLGEAREAGGAGDGAKDQAPGEPGEPGEGRTPVDRFAAELETAARGVLAVRPRADPVPGWVFAGMGLVSLLVLLPPGLALAGMFRTSPGAFALALPATATLFLFLVGPAIAGLALAVLRLEAGADLGFEGLSNFVRAVEDPGFLRGCRNTLLYAAVVVPANLGSALFLALCIQPLGQRMRTLFRGAFYLPGVASIVALALVWRQILDERGGLLEKLAAPGSWLGGLVRALLPCLERVPVALGIVGLGWLALGLLVRAPAGVREPQRYRVRRDLLGTGLVGLGLAWVALGIDPALARDPRPLGFLGSTQLSFWAVLLVVLVRGPGGSLLVYLAALENVDRELYEAAEVDGAGPWLRFYHVTLPALGTTTMFLAITGIVDSFQAFGQVFLLTDGGPGFSSTVVVHRMYLAAFRDLDFGLAAAQGAMLFGAIAALGAARAGSEESLG